MQLARIRIRQGARTRQLARIRTMQLAVIGIRQLWKGIR
jgi:hypothetical protein